MLAVIAALLTLHWLVSAINDLTARLGNALALQRNFLADAAHELRTGGLLVSCLFPT